MNYPEHIDLHMHSTSSDGTDTPEELLSHVRDAGLELFALTDHDSVEGCRIMQKVLTEEDPKFLTGVEFGCKDELGKYHILGYGYDPWAKTMEAAIHTGHLLRMHKLKKRLQLLKDSFEVSFSEEDLEWLYSMENPGKPHLAHLLVKDRYAENKSEAFDRFLEKLEVVDDYLRPEQAIAAILAGGGIPVLAHPSYGDGDQLIMGEKMDARLRHLLPMGLKGLEAYYSGFTDRIHEEVVDFAKKYDLYITAGSDYHGKNKLVELGETGLKKASEAEPGLRKFLETIQNKYVNQ